MTPMTGLPLPQVATKAEGIPATPLSTSKPCPFISSAKSFDDLSSTRPSSAYSQMASLISTRRSLLSSIHLQAFSFITITIKL